MPNYRRYFAPGGTYFFTVTLMDRNADWLTRHIETLRDAFRRVRQSRTFVIEACCILPEHLHTMWTLPACDEDYSSRWREVQKIFSQTVVAMETLDRSVPIWQSRFWEHTVLNESDFRNHMDYVHFNPVKHGLVESVKDWPYSTFHKAVEAGFYPEDWRGKGVVDLRAGERR